MQKTFAFLIASLGLALATHANDGDGFFDLFEQDFSPTYDAVIEELDYTKQLNPGDPSGLFRFSRFLMVGDSVSVNIDNDGGIFDSQIYMANNLVGFKGPNAQFAYRMRPEDFKYVDSFEWLKLNKLHFIMDRSLIHFEGEQFAMKEPRTTLFAQNFNLNCDRHPDYPLNDGDGFVSGCLNSGEAKPLSGRAFPIEYKLKSEDQSSDQAVLSGTFTYFEGGHDQFHVKANRVDAVIEETTEIVSDNVDVICRKKADLITIDEENLLYPCLKDISYQSRRLDLRLHSQEVEGEIDKINILNPNAIHSQEGFSFRGEFFDYISETTNFRTNAVKVDCDAAMGAPDDIGSYFQSCLETGRFRSKRKDHLDIELTIKEPKTETEEAFYLNLKGNVESLDTKQSTMQINASRMDLNIDDDLFFNINKIDWNCGKVEGQRELSIPLILEQCKDDSRINIDDVLVNHFTKRDDPIQFLIRPRIITSSNTEAEARIPEMTMLAKNTVKIFNDLYVKCQKLEEADLFKIHDIIEGCAKNAEIKLDKLYTNEEEIDPQAILENRTNIRRKKNTIKHPSVTDVNAIIKNGHIRVSLESRFMGMKPNVYFSGPVVFDKEARILTIKVKKLKLPIILNSKMIFRMILRSLVEGEMVEVNDNTEIRISL